MVEIPPEIVTSIGTGLPETIVANLITSFLVELGKALNRISEQHRYDISPISYEGLDDFWKAYRRQEIERGDPVCIYGIFSDLGLAMPAPRPDEAIRGVRNSLEELLHCFSDDSNLELHEQILRFDGHIDMLRLWLGSCIRLPPIKGFRYCTLFDENDIIPVRGLPVFLRKNAQFKSSPFYGEVRGYVADLPPNWKRILTVQNNKPLAIVVDSDAGGTVENHGRLTNPLYLSYWMILRYASGDGCVVATRGDYSDKKNYKACRNFLRTTADVEIKKMKAQLLFEYDQVKRITRYKQRLDLRQMNEILGQ
jgi:hypothetical protein